MIKKKKKILIFILLITFFSVKVINLTYIYFSNLNAENKEIDKLEVKEEKNSTNKVFIDIEGAVLNPGMYEVEADLRLGKVIEKAGGLTHANSKCINLASKIQDEQYIYIPSEEEMCENEKSLSQNNKKDDDLININTSSANELETLTGIGKTRAQDIIEYRNSNGNFNSKEDIKNVSGIGDSTYEKIKDQICI